MYLSTVEPLGIAVVVEYVLLVRSIADFCRFVVGLYRYALTLVLDGVTLLDVHRLILVLFVEASAVCVCDFWSVLVSVNDAFAVQDGGHVFVMEVRFYEWTNAERCVKCEVKTRHVMELQPQPLLYVGQKIGVL